jgi:hypothetical protein
MDRLPLPPAPWLIPVLLIPLAVASLLWASVHALSKSDDLMRRAEEISLFVRGLDPYQDPDMTYPPSALPIFTPLVAPFGPEALRGFWLGLNLTTLGVFAWVVGRIWGADWPGWLRAALMLTTVATKPVRGGIGLGQFHLLPLTLVLIGFLAWERRRPVVAGLLIGVALAKPTMVLPFLTVLVLRRAWLPLAVASIVQTVSWLAAALWLGIDPLGLAREWIAVAKTQETAGLMDLPSLIHRAWPEASSSASLLPVLILGVGSWGMGVLRRRSNQALLATASFLAAIFTYHRPYDLVLLIPPLAYLVGVVGRPGWKSWGSVSLVMIWGLALMWPSHPSITGGFENLYESIFVPLAYSYLVILVLAIVAEAPAYPRARDLASSRSETSVVNPIPGPARFGKGSASLTQLDKASARASTRAGWSDSSLRQASE